VRRLILAVVVLVGLPLAPAAEGRTALPALPALFMRQIRAIKAAPNAPAVLLPPTMPLDAAGCRTPIRRRRTLGLWL
jgi:hypothetical protein